ncbi:Eukaryotic translation initiation factor 4E-1 [Capsicum chinense]|nr:Eukaryotic translation initiation factor 4E-1 [Capsicum chinense]
MADEGNKTTMLGEYKTSSMEDGGEEGEIVGESDATTSSSLGKPITMKHPLEHSWTFWFDNPSGKSKQAAWGSSIRPIYTFSTAEDFWRNTDHILEISDDGSNSPGAETGGSTGKDRRTCT